MDERPRYSPEPRPNLFALQPTEDSLVMLQRQGRTEEAQQLQATVDATIGNLMNFEDESFTFPTLLYSAQLAAQAGSADLLELVKVRMYYALPILDPLQNSTEGKALIKASSETYLNAAVAKRDEGLDLRSKGKLEEAEQAFIKAQIFQLSSLEDTEDLAFSKDVSYEQAHAIDKEIQTSLERTEVVDIFFDDTIIQAYMDMGNVIDAIVAGELQVDGVDQRWLTVYEKAKFIDWDRFPQAKEANNNAEEYVAKKHGISLEQIKRYGDYSFKEFMGDVTEN